MTVHGAAKGNGLAPLTVTTLFGVSPSFPLGFVTFCLVKSWVFFVKTDSLSIWLSFAVAATPPPLQLMRYALSVISDLLR